MNTKFWKPSITSQFKVCPIPFHMDTYRGCVYNCNYCFARDLCTFSRRNSKHKQFHYLEGNRPDRLEAWIKRTLAKDYDYNKAEEVAFKERIPLKIGATSDPCPPIEVEECVTLNTLLVLDKYDYPVEIQTKNPEVLYQIVVPILSARKNLGYKEGLPNWTIAVTLISTDEKFLHACAPNAPSAMNRLRAIKYLTDLGLPVMVKIQPAIYPKVIKDLPRLVKKIKKAGCWAFNTEGLKVRIAMPHKEQQIMQTIGDYLKYNIRDYYKTCGINTGSDWEMTHANKMQYTELAIKLAKKHKLKYFSADNHMGCVGCSSECCGTEVLRDYKIWGQNKRTYYFPHNTILLGQPQFSGELGKCKVNFMRSSKYKDKTMSEVFKLDHKSVTIRKRDCNIPWE